MNTTTTTTAPSTTAPSATAPSATTVISGPPALAKFAGVIAIAAAGFSVFAWPSPLAIAVTTLAAVIAWRLSRLAIVIEGEDLVLRNLFATTRIPLANADVRRANTDLRTRTAWGGHVIPPHSIPKMDDDNMQTEATLIRIVDRADNDRSTHTDCSLGINRKTQEKLFHELQAAIAG